MWEIYDELIQSVPEGPRIRRLYRSQRRIYLESDAGIGSAMLFDQQPLDLTVYQGAELADVARQIKSWDFNKASVGLAAINSYLNQKPSIQKGRFELLGDHDIFADYANSTQKIATIGHFYYVDQYPELAKRLTVFELNPRPGDYPSSACDFMLPDMDVVLITGSTLVNKTLPHLLELTHDAQVILVGGSTPMTDQLLQHGIDILAGTIISEIPKDGGNHKVKGTPLSVKSRFAQSYIS